MVFSLFTSHGSARSHSCFADDPTILALKVSYTLFAHCWWPFHPCHQRHFPTRTLLMTIPSLPSTSLPHLHTVDDLTFHTNSYHQRTQPTSPTFSESSDLALNVTSHSPTVDDRFFLTNTYPHRSQPTSPTVDDPFCLTNTLNTHNPPHPLLMTLLALPIFSTHTTHLVHCWWPFLPYQYPQCTLHSLRSVPNICTRVKVFLPVSTMWRMHGCVSPWAVSTLCIKVLLRLAGVTVMKLSPMFFG